MKSLYLAGKTGFIGNLIFNNLKNNLNIIPIFRNKSFQTEIRDGALKNLNPMLIYAAGNKDIKLCEKNFDIALEANFQYLKTLAKDLNNPHIIYLSTDYVFDGMDGSYSFNDSQSPNTNYGKSKVEAEKWLMNDYKGTSTILRLSTICSDNSSFIKFLLEESEQKDSIIEVADNSFFSPTSIKLLIECLIFLCDEKLTGVYHLSGPRISRAEFAKTILRLYKKKSLLISCDYKNINEFLRPDLSLINSFLDMHDYKHKQFFKSLETVFSKGYSIEDFYEKNIL